MGTRLLSLNGLLLCGLYQWIGGAEPDTISTPHLQGPGPLTHELIEKASAALSDLVSNALVVVVVVVHSSSDIVLLIESSDLVLKSYVYLWGIQCPCPLAR